MKVLPRGLSLHLRRELRTTFVCVALTQIRDAGCAAAVAQPGRSTSRQAHRRDVARFSPHLGRAVTLTGTRQISPAALTMRRCLHPQRSLFMNRSTKFAGVAAVAAVFVSTGAHAQSRAQYESMVATHARNNNVPEALVHRVIVRESKYNAGLV